MAYITAAPSQFRLGRRLLGAPRRRLGQTPTLFIPNVAANWVYQSPFSAPSVAAPPPPSASGAPAASSSIPGSTIADYAYNAATGNLTQSQVQAITAQNTAAYVQAGMDPSAASAQAAADVDSALSTYTGPGAFGVTWTGAQPSSSTWASALNPANWFTNPDGSINWLLVGGIGVGVVALVFLLRK
jgi:hypothetical protein